MDLQRCFHASLSSPQLPAELRQKYWTCHTPVMAYLQAGTLFMHHRPSYGNCAAHQLAVVERADAIAYDRVPRGVACACRHFRSKAAATHTMGFLAERAMAGTAAPALAPAVTSAQHSKAQRRKGGAPAPASGSQA